MPFKPHMRICEFEAYKSVYCGLCKELSRSFGPFARFTLNYDFTFLAVLDMAVNESSSPKTKNERCAFNPLIKKPCCQSCGELKNSASVGMILLYYKVLDNIADERFIKKMLYLLIRPLAKHSRDKAVKGGFSAVDSFIAKEMAAQAELEKRQCKSPDEAAEPFAKILGFVFETLLLEEGQKRVLSRLGYLMGRLIYLLDALDDIEEDRRKGSYNPFLAAAAAGEDISSRRQSAVLSLNLTIGEIIKTYQLLKIYRYKPILDNIIELGLKSAVQRAAEGSNVNDKGNEEPVNTPALKGEVNL